MAKSAAIGVIPMPPVSMSTIEGLADAVLEELCPQALLSPMPIPLLSLVDYRLPEMGIHVAPVEDGDLPGAAAITDPESTDGINIMVRSSVWLDFIRGGRRAHFARATIAHEIGHAVLHVRTIRRRLATKETSKHMLARVDPRTIPPYREPEWQAWALAGSFMAPRASLVQLGPRPSVDLVASTYQISESFAFNHMRRLRLI
jgi:hypothetical protein